MKKYVSLILTTIMATTLILSGCSSNSSTDSSTAGNSDEKVIEMRLMHCVAPTTVHGQIATHMKEQIEKVTNGKVKVTVYPSSQITTVDKELSLVGDGSMEASYNIAGPTEAVIPLYGVGMIPFLFGAEEVGDGKLLTAINYDKEFNEIIQKSAEEKGYKIFVNIPSMLGNNLSANNVRPLIKPSDGAGLKIRTPGGKYYDMFISATGSSPTVIASAEVPVGLSQGVFDGLISYYAHIQVNQWKVKYLTGPTMMINGTPLVINLEWWNNLPADIRDAIENEAIPEIFEYAVALCSKAEKESLQIMQDEWGTEYNEWDFNDPEIKKFVEDLRQQGIDDFVSNNGEAGRKLVDIVLQKRAELGMY